MWPAEQFVTNKAYEVCKYWINQYFYSSATVILINLNTWNSLPKDLQDLLATVCQEEEVSNIEFFKTRDIQYQKAFVDNGMKPITLSPADATWYVKLANDTKWNEAKKLISQEDWNTLNKMLNK